MLVQSFCIGASRSMIGFQSRFLLAFSQFEAAIKTWKKLYWKTAVERSVARMPPRDSIVREKKKEGKLKSLIRLIHAIAHGYR